MKLSISCRAISCTCSFRDCKAAVLSVVGRRLKNSKEDLLNTLALSEVCIDYTPLRTSNSVSDSGLNKVSYIREIYVFVWGLQIKRIEPFVSWAP